MITYVLEMLLATACGVLIGLERTMRMKSAGIRTHALLAVGACLITILSKYAFNTDANVADPARVAAQIIASVGFLGAGVIFREGDVLKGLSTAAGLWATSAVGMSIGAGEILLGIILTLLILFVQFIFHVFPAGFDAYSENEIVIILEKNDEVENKIKEISSQHQVKVKGRTLSKENGVVTIEYHLVHKYKCNIKEEFEKLIDYDCVKSIVLK